MITWLNLRFENFKRVQKKDGDPFTLAMCAGRSVRNSVIVASLLTTSIFSLSTSAATIEFPDEELSQETVLPVFDQPTAVKRRIVPLEHRLGITAFGGLGLNDPFFNPAVFGGTLAYHFTNEMGIELLGASYSRNSSQYVGAIKNATQVNTGQPCTAGQCPDFHYAPSINSLMFLDFKWSPFYGKISITKSMVMNMMTNFYLGVGSVSVGDQSPFGGSLGLGQEFYFSSHVGIRADLRSFIYSGPYVANSKQLTTATSVPSDSTFSQQTTFSLLFNLGLIYLF